MKKPHWSERWWVILLFGLMLTAATPFIYWDLAEWEADPNAGGRSMNCFAALVYKVGGKWLLCGLCLAVGLFLIGFGLRQRWPRSISGRCANAVDGADSEAEQPSQDADGTTGNGSKPSP